MGKRAEESARRAGRPRIDVIGKRIIKEVIYKPIFHWTEWDVWNFIERYELPYPCLYDEGFRRIGCVICPFIVGGNQARLNIHKERWPSLYKAFENSVTDWFASYRTKPRHQQQETAKEYLEWWYRGGE